MASKTVYSMLQTSIQRSQRTLSHTSPRLSTTFLRRIQKEKKQTHVKNKVIEKTDHQSWTTMTYDDRSYHIPYTFIMENLPDEDVYKPKNKKVEKNKEEKKNGLLNVLWMKTKQMQLEDTIN